jgi:sodium/hydrogen exchanger 10/11
MAMDPDFLLVLFLPALIFESAANADFHTMKMQKWKILIMAFPMLLGATYATASVMYWVLGYQEVMPWSACVLFGAVISATDPVAVVSLLKELGTPKAIGTLIEGESLFNDGTAVVVFYVALDFVLGKELTTGEIVVKFLQLSLGGPLLGIAFGILLEFWLSRIHNKPKLEVNLTICFSYLTFYVAELP